MKIKGMFTILTVSLLAILAVLSYFVFYTVSIGLFFAVEGTIILILVYLFLFYRRIVKPLHAIGTAEQLRAFIDNLERCYKNIMEFQDNKDKESKSK